MSGVGRDKVDITPETQKRDFDVNEKVWVIAEQFRNKEFSVDPEELFIQWKEQYGQNPNNFVVENNFERLHELEPVDRLFFLSQAARFLTITPSMVGKYAAAFPEDIRAVHSMFVSSNGHPQTTSEFNLFSLLAPYMREIDPHIGDSYHSFEQYEEKAARRELAPGALLKNFDYSVDRFEQFGHAARGFLDAFEQADQLTMHGTHVIDTSRIFTGDYLVLPPEQKALFLRTAIAELQFALVFEETFNSVFTKERVDEDRQRHKRAAMDNGKGFGYVPQYPQYDVAHSMLYKTYQPVSVYGHPQEYFDRDMDRTAEIGGDVEEYPFHRLLLAVLKELRNIEAGQDETVDVVVDFWDKNRNPIFGNAVADVLSHQHPNRAASELLQLLRKEKEDKTPLTAMLYRLEFGRVGISEEGVQYLERMYDLGEYNNPDYHVSRLTCEGEVGVFDEDLKLIRYFHLGDLSSDETKVRAQILDFTYETLFVKKPGETPEEHEERLQYLKEFKENYYQIAQDKIFEETGVRLNNLTFREQGWFVIYFNEADDAQKDRLRAFVRNFEEEGLKTFLSLEHDRGMGEKILAIAESVDEPTSQKIFDKYSKIVGVTDKIRDYLHENFGSEYLSEETIDKIIDNILRRGKDLLASFAAQIKEATNKDELSAEIQSSLDRINTNIILFANIIKQLPREEVANLDLKEIPVIEKIQDITGAELAQNRELVEKMKAIIRKQFPSGDDEVFEREITGNEDIRFTISLIDGEILSFFAKKRIGERLDYVDWFISNPDTEVKGLGEATVKLGFETDKEMGHAYYAVAKPHVKSFPISIETLGFCAFAGSTADGEYKHHYVRMSRLPEDNSLVTKAMTEEQKEGLKQTIGSLCSEPNEVQYILSQGKTLRVCKVEFSKGIGSSDDVTKDDRDGWIMAEIERQYADGYILSSFMGESDEKNNRIFYAVFEEDANTLKREKINSLAHAA